MRFIAEGATGCESDVVAYVTNAEAATAFFHSEGRVSAAYLCYKFAGQEWMAYPELVIALKDNVKLTPLDAVKDQAREFMVSGTVYDEENRFGFVPVESACASLPVESGVQGQSLGEGVTMFTWTFTTETPAWQFCFYTNGNWTSFEEPIAVSVFYVTEMKAVDLGADNILVRRVEKEFGVLGNGVERTGNDLFFVPAASEGCSRHYDIDVNREGRARNARLRTEVASGEYELCYQFFGFDYVRYASVKLSVISFTELRTAVGSATVAVKDMSKAVHGGGAVAAAERRGQGVVRAGERGVRRRGAREPLRRGGPRDDGGGLHGSPERGDARVRLPRDGLRGAVLPVLQRGRGGHGREGDGEGGDADGAAGDSQERGEQRGVHRHGHRQWRPGEVGAERPCVRGGGLRGDGGERAGDVHHRDGHGGRRLLQALLRVRRRGQGEGLPGADSARDGHEGGRGERGLPQVRGVDGGGGQRGARGVHAVLRARGRPGGGVQHDEERGSAGRGESHGGPGQRARALRAGGREQPLLPGVRGRRVQQRVDGVAVRAGAAGQRGGRDGESQPRAERVPGGGGHREVAARARLGGPVRQAGVRGEGGGLHAGEGERGGRGRDGLRRGEDGVLDEADLRGADLQRHEGDADVPQERGGDAEPPVRVLPDGQAGVRGGRARGLPQHGAGAGEARGCRRSRWTT